MEDHKQYVLSAERPGTTEYLDLRQRVGWHTFDFDRADRALDRSVFMVCMRMESELIGFGRIVGDGQVYFYLQDILVRPEHQGKGIGTRILDALMRFLDERAPHDSGAFIGLMIAPGLLSFYKKAGFGEFPAATPALRIWRNY